MIKIQLLSLKCIFNLIVCKLVMSRNLGDYYLQSHFTFQTSLQWVGTPPCSDTKPTIRPQFASKC